MRKANKKLLPVINHPKSIERKYLAGVRQLLKYLNGEVKNKVIPIIKDNMLNEQLDINAGTAALIEQIIKDINSDVLGNNIADRAIRNFVSSLDKYNKSKFQGIDLGAVILNEGIADELRISTSWNVSLITNMKSEILTKITNAVLLHATTSSSENLIKQIQHISKVGDSRAKLIARDQTAKLNASLTRIRQENLGITEFLWLSSEDERVRHTHALANENVYKWDKGAPNGQGGQMWPGSEIQCRCTAVGIVPK